MLENSPGRGTTQTWRVTDSGIMIDWQVVPYSQSTCSIYMGRGGTRAK